MPRHGIAARSFILARLALGLAVSLAACGSESGPSMPPDLALVPVDSMYDFSVFATSPPGDAHRQLILERGGRIVLRKDGIRQDSAFLNISNLTGQGHEYGVLGLAFHPAYASNRRFFVYYIDNNADARLVEFQADPDFDHASPMIVHSLLTQAVDSDAVHYGGTIAFGPDGYLYVGMGDGTTGGTPSSPAQDSTSILGKMLRLDVNGAAPYAIPPDNPYVGRPGWREEIYMLGLRNPYRWSFDRANGDLYLGIVGEDSWESVAWVPRQAQPGANLGWPIVEGSHCFRPATGCSTAGLTLPVVEYSHSEGCSVTGGYVYRGSAISGLRGTYFYGDFCGGFVRSFRISGGTAVDRMTYPGFVQGDNIVGFGEDAGGEIYVVYASGKIWKIVAQ